MRLSKASRFLILGVALLFTGCGVMSGFYRQRPARFPHKVHLENGLECATCHSGLDEGVEPGMPDVDACQVCHGAPEDVEKILKPFLKDGQANWTSITRLDGKEVKFAHPGHLKAGLKCAECHLGIETSNAVDEKVRLSMDDCMNCHSDRSQPTTCATCHQKISQQWMPPNHQRNWPRMHGQTVRNDSDALLDRCTLCHSETHCSGCHQNNKPKDHTNLWRLKTHGASASMDRERCTACHRTDFCRDCHSTTMPYTHTPAWRPPTALHCQNCHFPVEETDCYVCHKTAH